MADDAKLKLHYLNGRGRAELIRYILKYAGRQFEDIRYNRETEWPNVKSKFPTGQVPVLEIEHGGKTHMLSQSVAIARFVATKCKLAGANALEEAECDEVAQCIEELYAVAFLTVFFETDDERKEKAKNKLRTENYPRVFGHLEKKLAANGGHHIVGNNWTWADFYISQGITLLKHFRLDCEALDQFTGLVALTKSVEEIPAIAAWIKIRPETTF